MSISLYHVLSERGQLFCCAAGRLGAGRLGAGVAIITYPR